MPPPSDQARWFAEEVHPHERDLRAWLRNQFPGTCEVDDVVQESYARLLRARAATPVACARAYLFTTARNVARALFRRPRIFAPVSAPLLEAVTDGVDVAEQVSTRQEITVLLEAIDALPGRCREIFILRKLQGLSQREVAARLNLSEQTIQVQVARGAKRCVQFLRQRGITRSGRAGGKEAHG